MKYKTLLSSSSVLFGMALAYYICCFLFTVAMNVFADSISDEHKHSDSSIERMLIQAKRYTRIYHDDGFELPVWSRVYSADTIVQIVGKFKRKNNDSKKADRRAWSTNYRQKLSLKDWQEKNKPKFDTIFAIDTLVTSAEIAKIENFEANSNDNKFDLNLNKFHRYTETNIDITPKSRFYYYVLLSRSNLKVLFYIFFFYQLLKIVLLLQSNFSFAENIFRRVNRMGWTLLGYVFLRFATTYIVAVSYDTIFINSNSTILNHIRPFNIMIPRYDFNFEIFSAGLLLIIFSFLMKRASEIEENWSLTI